MPIMSGILVVVIIMVVYVAIQAFIGISQDKGEEKYNEEE